VRFRVVTYNVHKCRGMDGRVRPQRIAAVLREVAADVVALQEVLSVPGADHATDQARFLADALEMELRFGATREVPGGCYGNAVMSRFPLGTGRSHDLSVPGREKRGCLRADVHLAPGRWLHVFNVHLGTAFLERRVQARRLVAAEILENHELKGPRMVLGDFNEWATGLATRLLRSNLNSVDIRTHLRRRRTYPGMVPVLHLDHIYYDDPLELQALVLHRTRLALVASDHLPLVADFHLPAR
jgi:endonuclease/exonuclease/phosphatase family metal-dependent hydrolase